MDIMRQSSHILKTTEEKKNGGKERSSHFLILEISSHSKKMRAEEYGLQRSGVYPLVLWH